MCEHCGCSESDKKTFEAKVQEVVDIIRPMLQNHGGDMELVAVDDDNTVRVRLRGACCGCPGARATLKNGVEQIMKEKLPEVKQVLAVD